MLATRPATSPAIARRMLELEVVSVTIQAWNATAAARPAISPETAEVPGLAVLLVAATAVVATAVASSSSAEARHATLAVVRRRQFPNFEILC